MCAIFGIVGDYDQKEAEKAFASLRHRGMDGSASIVQPSLFLGSHRLAITSCGEPMLQPLEREGYMLLFNGEIYNYQELAESLGVTGESEAEVLLASYRAWGDDFVKHLRGMYAIAL
ncbi:MAG TPA: asparagine synthetase B, partial [Epsilonproteobacteria bacterium]|nr:asparagine synthetase B [Campylobacterota bacterium]